jgi:hypothetical protein
MTRQEALRELRRQHIEDSRLGYDGHNRHPLPTLIAKARQPTAASAAISVPAQRLRCY